MSEPVVQRQADSQDERRNTAMITVSGKCMCARCESRTSDIYRMVGSCYNCHTGDILMIYRAGDRAAPLDCPVCQNMHSVQPRRLASADEIPAAPVESA